MSIAVAYWVLGLGSSFTKYEKVEFTSAYADSNPGNYTVNMILKNTGSATATVDATTIFYNGKPAVAYGVFAPDANFTTVTMDPGVTRGFKINFTSVVNTPWQSGMTVEVMIQTSAGKQYPKVITLP
jgi:archaellum component FlaG (FlaF/FlaG flagellin family)